MHAIALAVVLTLSQAKPTLLPEPEQSEFTASNRTMVIQMLVSIGVSLAFGMGIGVGWVCMEVWNAPRFGRPINICGRGL